MNKQSTIIIIVLLVLGLLGVYMLVSNDQEKPETDTSQTAVEQNGEQAMEIDLFDPINFLPKAPESAINYNLTSASVNYAVQKRFFDKPDAEVVGSTDNVAGLGWYNEDNSAFALAAHLDFGSIVSDNTTRDSDVLGLFKDSNILIMADVEEEDALILDTEVQLQVPVLLTINGIQRNVVFDVTATLTEEDFTAVGETSILMSDFGINPPSLAEVYTVDDETILSFDVEGVADVQAMMEETSAIEEEDVMTDDENTIEEDEIVEDNTTMEVENDELMEEEPIEE
ncbi:YceI family protein [Patescibacteria group bacterium]